MSDWWDELLPTRPHAKPPGLLPMLRVVAYDIADSRRLNRVANLCEDHAVRVQRSLFECWLDEAEFASFWRKLAAEIDHTEDRLVAYALDQRGARERLTLGRTMVCTDKVLCYFV
jgi:CRISPR-associated protein Cas2